MVPFLSFHSMVAYGTPFSLPSIFLFTCQHFSIKMFLVFPIPDRKRIPELKPCSSLSTNANNDRHPTTNANKRRSHYYNIFLLMRLFCLRAGSLLLLSSISSFSPTPLYYRQRQLQLLFVYTALILWRARVDTLHHGRYRPPFLILVNRVLTQVLSILRYYTWATRPEAAFQPPHLPPLLAEVLGLE